MKKENAYQAGLIKRIKERMPEAIVLKNDASYIQGIPDLIVLKEGKWGALECKREKSAKHQPNQDYYVDKMDEMSFAAFVYPENEKEILDALQRALEC